MAREAWPGKAAVARLRDDVDGQLVEVSLPKMDDLFAQLANPHFIAEHAGLTQTCGWLDAWVCAPSTYAVIPRCTRHVVAAVDFAREHHVRLVVKGGGHSYHGTSCTAGSLLLWMKELAAITVHPRSVTVGAGATWRAVYDRVTTQGGRYVQGAGALTVGVGGLISSGGFGSFSKRYGLAAAGLIDAEVVTADGAVRIASAASEPELFWALKGGGGGSFGVITRVTLQTHDLPSTVGAVSGRIAAASDAAFHKLVGALVALYAERLFDPHWGERIIFGSDNTVDINMVFQGLDPCAVEQCWEPLLQRIVVEPAWSLADWTISCVPAGRFWDADAQPHLFARDPRPGVPATNVAMAGDLRRAGQFVHGYRSVWLPAELLAADRQSALSDALFACTRHWDVCLHFNKGLAGADPRAIEAARDTPMNPAVLDAFALARCSAQGPPAFPGWAGHEPDVAVGREQAKRVHAAIDELLRVAPRGGTYVAESDFFEKDWQRSFWGPHYPRLVSVKRRYDRDGLFTVHHGVGTPEY